MFTRALIVLGLGFGSSGFAGGLPSSFFDVTKSGCDVLLRVEAQKLRLEFARVSLRPVAGSDRTDILDILSDPELARMYLNWGEGPPDLADRYFNFRLRPVLQSEPNERGEGRVRTVRLLVEERRNRLVPGLVHIKRFEESGIWEIGYALDATVRGFGFGTEIVRGMVDEIRALDPKAVIEAVPRRDNLASLALLHKTGFIPDDIHLPEELRPYFSLHRMASPNAFVTLPAAND